MRWWPESRRWSSGSSTLRQLLKTEGRCCKQYAYLRIWGWLVQCVISLLEYGVGRSNSAPVKLIGPIVPSDSHMRGVATMLQGSTGRRCHTESLGYSSPNL